MAARTPEQWADLINQIASAVYKTGLWLCAIAATGHYLGRW